jgi:hypothetical protein
MPKSSTVDPQSPYGKWVLSVLAAHGLNTRSQRPRTTVPHATVRGWLDDTPPQMDGVLKFAKGMREDVNTALALANYPPLPDEAEDEGEDVDAFRAREARKLSAEFNVPLAINFEPRADLSMAEAKAEMADIRRELEEKRARKAT